MSILGLSGCSTSPPPPASEVCSTQWIQSNVSDALQDMQNELQSALSVLRLAAKHAGAGHSDDAIKILIAAGAIHNFEKSLSQAKGFSDLTLLAKSCNDTGIIEKALETLLKNSHVLGARSIANTIVKDIKV